MNERDNGNNAGHADNTQNQYYAPPTPRRTEFMPGPAKQKRTTPLWVTIAAAVGGLVLGVAIGNGGKTTTADAANAGAATTTNSTSQGSTAQAAVANPTTTKPAAAPAPVKPAKTVVLTTSGNGIKQTKMFTTGADWSVTYTFDCSNFGMKGNFQLSTDSDLNILANALAAKGGDTTYQHDNPGQHSLSVNSECDWTLKVTDGDAG